MPPAVKEYLSLSGKHKELENNSSFERGSELNFFKEALRKN